MAVIASELQVDLARIPRVRARPVASYGVSFWVAAVWAASFCYALLRYVVFGPHSVAEIPLFVLNKSIAVTSLALFGLALAEGRRRRRQRTRAFARVAIWLVLVHVVISSLLFVAGYYASLRFASGWLHSRGWLAILMGIAGVGTLLWLRGRGAQPWARMVRLLCVVLGLLHVVFLGLPGWFTPDRWHGAMPPITLLSALIGGVGLWVGVRALRDGARS